MGTPFSTDLRLNRFNDLTEILTLELIQILSENYKAGKLSLGNNLPKKNSKKEVFYTITNSEFENLLLTFKYKQVKFGNPYKIILESRGNDSPAKLKISLNDDIVAKLPEKMISELTDRFYEFLSE